MCGDIPWFCRPLFAIALPSSGTTVSIPLGDDSCVQANYKGTNAVTWSGPEGTTEVQLSETLAARDRDMKLLSVPALTKQGMAILFLPSKALIVDLREYYKLIGLSNRQNDGM